MENSNQITNERVILVGVIVENCSTPREKDDRRLSFEELSVLAETCGCTVVGRVRQNRPNPDNAYCVGKGTAENIKELCEMTDADAIIFDNELTGSQIKNLEDLTEVKVIDRTMLILDIFASRAVSNEGKLQVELAQLRYRLPRLVEFTV